MQDALQAYGAQAEFGVFYGSFMGAKEEEERVGRSTNPSGSAGFASALGGTPCAQGHMHQVARYMCGVTGHTCGSPLGMLSAALLTGAGEGPGHPSP